MGLVIYHWLAINANILVSFCAVKYFWHLFYVPDCQVWSRLSHYMLMCLLLFRSRLQMTAHEVSISFNSFIPEGEGINMNDSPKGFHKWCTSIAIAKFPKSYIVLAKSMNQQISPLFKSRLGQRLASGFRQAPILYVTTPSVLWQYCLLAYFTEWSSTQLMKGYYPLLLLMLPPLLLLFKGL